MLYFIHYGLVYALYLALLDRSYAEVYALVIVAILVSVRACKRYRLGRVDAVYRGNFARARACGSARYAECADVYRLYRNFLVSFRLRYPLVRYAVCAVDHVAEEIAAAS